MIEMRDESSINIVNNVVKKGNNINEAQKTSENIEIKDSKDENIISINNSENSQHRISLGKPSKSKSKSQKSFVTNTENEEKEIEEEEVIPPPNISDFLPCREKEQEIIYKYIKTGLYTKGNYSSLYISGMPGTGKTESVKRVIEIFFSGCPTGLFIHFIWNN